MKRTLLKLLLVLAVCTGIDLAAQNMPLKIAVIDMNRVFQEYNKTKINEAKLKKQADIYKEYSMQLAQSLNKLRQEFVKLRDDSQNMVYTAAERENRRLNAQEKYRQARAGLGAGDPVNRPAGVTEPSAPASSPRPADSVPVRGFKMEMKRPAEKTAVPSSGVKWTILLAVVLLFSVIPRILMTFRACPQAMWSMTVPFLMGVSLTSLTGPSEAIRARLPLSR